MLRWEATPAAEPRQQAAPQRRAVRQVRVRYPRPSNGRQRVRLPSQIPGGSRSRTSAVVFHLPDLDRPHQRIRLVRPIRPLSGKLNRRNGALHQHDLLSVLSAAPLGRATSAAGILFGTIPTKRRRLTHAICNFFTRGSSRRLVSLITSSPGNRGCSR